MPKVEFIYDQDCPNVDDARANLVKAFVRAKVIPNWQEYDRNAVDTPDHARKYGSPTVLVDGRDIAGVTPKDGNNCRIYDLKSASPGVPPVLMIAAALTGKSTKSSSWKSFLAAIPGIGIVLLPKLTCAACWPAYAAIMSSMGVGFFNYTEYLFPISVVALGIALFAMAFRATRRRGYGPFSIGFGASIILLAGKFYWDSNVVFYIGVAVLIAASFWNSWPRKVVTQDCPACET